MPVINYNFFLHNKTPPKDDFPDGSISIGYQVGKRYRTATRLGDLPHDSPWTSLLRAPHAFIPCTSKAAASAPHGLNPSSRIRLGDLGFFAGMQGNPGETQTVEELLFSMLPCAMLTHGSLLYPPFPSWHIPHPPPITGTPQSPGAPVSCPAKGSLGGDPAWRGARGRPHVKS